MYTVTYTETRNLDTRARRVSYRRARQDEGRAGGRRGSLGEMNKTRNKREISRFCAPGIKCPATLQPKRIRANQEATCTAIITREARACGGWRFAAVLISHNGRREGVDDGRADGEGAGGPRL